jgi:hypothetical protein
LLIAIITSVLSMLASILYGAGVAGLALAEACQILGVVTLIILWFTGHNRNKKPREILVLLLSLIPFMVIIVFLVTFIVYLNARRQRASVERRKELVEEMKEEAVDTFVHYSANVTSNVASALHSQKAPRASGVERAVSRVVGPATGKTVAEHANTVLTTLATLLILTAAIASTLPIAQPHLPGGVPGTFTTFHLPTADSNVLGITAGPDGNLWMTEYTGGGVGGVSRIVRMTPIGAVRDFLVPSADAEPAGITVGPDGNLWFTEIADGVAQERGSGALPPTGRSVSFMFPALVLAGESPKVWMATSGSRAGR